MASDKVPTTDGQYSAATPLGKGCGSYALAVSTSNASITLPAGQYLVWLASRTGTVGVFCKFGGTATVPADATVDAEVFGFPGDATERIYKSPNDSDLNVILTSGASSSTLYIVALP